MLGDEKKKIQEKTNLWLASRRFPAFYDDCKF